jgi:hypothetical protein
MLYIKLGDAGELILYCKNCSYISQPESNEHGMMCVFSSAAGENEADYKQYMTKDIKNDNTLPRVRHIKCPNADCKSTDKDREVIYMKYDHTNLKYIYFCCTCENFWHN